MYVVGDLLSFCRPSSCNFFDLLEPIMGKKNSQPSMQIDKKKSSLKKPSRLKRGETWSEFVCKNREVTFCLL